MKWLTEMLHLTSPLQQSPAAEIREVQHMLNVKQDGVYGPITANAVYSWKYRVGFHEKFVNHSLTPSESQWLFGTQKQTIAMRLRASGRKPAPTVESIDVRAMNTMVGWAKAGTYETGSNYVPRLANIAKEFGLSDQYQKMGFPWCSFATELSALANGSTSAKDLFSGPFNSKLVLYVPAIYGYAVEHKYGLSVVGWPAARPGDLVVFNWDGGVPDHMGRVVSKKDSDTLLTVEGNTSAGATGSQTNGDGLYMRIRYRANVHGFIREA